MLLVWAFCLSGTTLRAEPVTLSWPQPAGQGSDVFITYSYSNLLSGSFLLISPAELRAATEEALGLWATFAPLNFVERPDSGPATADTPYDAAGHPQIRLGYHPTEDLAHGYYPGVDGLGGDVHFAEGIPWTLGGHWNFLEAVTHELGHALGLDHELDRPAIMNPSYPLERFGGLGTAFLLPPDIERIRALYGSGRGSVTPMQVTPDPATVILVGTGIATLAALRRRRRNADRGGIA